MPFYSDFEARDYDFGKRGVADTFPGPPLEVGDLCKNEFLLHNKNVYYITSVFWYSI